LCLRLDRGDLAQSYCLALILSDLLGRALEHLPVGAWSVTLDVVDEVAKLVLGRRAPALERASDLAANVDRMRAALHSGRVVSAPALVEHLSGRRHLPLGRGGARIGLV